MRTHILITVMALILTACASKREVASTQNQNDFYNENQHAHLIDGHASRIR